MAIKRVLILGSRGGFGKLFSSLLRAEGVRVDGVDLAASLDEPAGVESYVSCDVCRPCAGALALAREADCVLMCVPENVAIAALETLGHAFRPGSLVVDILSVKARIAETMKAFRRDIEALSIHPMFAPDLDARGQNVAAVMLVPGPRADDFVAWLRSWGAAVTFMSAEEHDRRTALVQAATHAAIIAYGLCVTELGIDPVATVPLMSPPHLAMLALFARITSLDPNVYFSIQADNPYAGRARTALIAATRAIDRMVASGDRQAFANRLAASKAHLGPVLDELTAQARRMLQTNPR